MLAKDALVFCLHEGHAQKHFRSCVSHVNTSYYITAQNHNTTTNFKGHRKASTKELRTETRITIIHVCMPRVKMQFKSMSKRLIIFCASRIFDKLYLTVLSFSWSSQPFQLTMWKAHSQREHTPLFLSPPK